MPTIKSKFDQIIQNQIKTNNLSHAYLIIGDFSPQIFLEMFKINFPDFFELREDPIKVGNIRDLIHWLNLKPHSSPKKLVVLYNIDKMTLEAANSVLKVLEEPPEFAIIILQAEKNDKILPTIISRCQIIRQESQTDIEIPANFLSKEKISQMSYKDRFDYVAKIIDDEDLEKIINLWEQEYRLELLSGKDVKEILEAIFHSRRLLSTNTSVKLLLENLIIKF